MKIVHLFGIAGVASDERPEARLWASRLEWPMLFVVLWILLQWYLQVTHALSPFISRISDWLVWLAFLAETTLLVRLVQHKRTYLLTNWLNLVIIVAGIPLLWDFELAGMLRSLRLVVVLLLLARMSKTMRRLLAQHQLV